MLFKKKRIHQQSGLNSNSVIFFALKNLIQKKPFLMTGVVFGFAGLAAFFVSAIYIKGWISAGHFSEIHKEAVQKKLSFIFEPYRWTMSQFPSTEAIPRLHIDIKFLNVQKITHQQEAARKLLKIVQGSNDWVPAKIRYNGETKKVKLRLKGDGVDHMVGDKWSFRVHVKKGEALFGMRRFSIQNPRTREYEGELLFNHALKREGILVPRYFFVNVTINGKDIGVMALEEHTSKELLESQNRREAPIIRFDDKLFFQARYAPFDDIFTNYKALSIRIIGSNPLKKSEAFLSYLKIGIGLLRGFVRGEIPASEVFDPVLVGRYLAVAKVWGAEHSLEFDDARFYYNPLTSKLEIIGHDGKVRFIDPLLYTEKPIIRRLLIDPKIKSVYSETLERIHREFKEGATLKWAQEIQEKSLRILRREFYSLEGIDLNKISERASLAYKLDQGLFDNYPDYLNVYYIDGGPESGILQITNILPNSVDVVSVKVINRLTGIEEQVASDLFSMVPFTLESTPFESNPTIKRIILAETIDLEKYNIQVTSKIMNGIQSMVHEAIPYFPILKSSPIPARSVSQLLSDFPFIAQTDSTTLLVKQGKWSVDGWLIVPQGFKLVISAGTLLSFSSSSGVIAKGPILINGTADNLVVLEGRSQGKGMGHWQGIFVSDTKEPSVWSNVIIRDTAGLSIKGWNLTAGTTFYQADAILKNVSFFGNRCEDALNIVRSKFELSEVSIKDAFSDGFDSDFSEGIVIKGNFENIGLAGGGDGIDVSGTIIDITETKFKNIGDKAVSAGEKSTVRATQLYIEGTGAGVVSKDGSHVVVENSTIRDFNIASMMVYIKKQEYGPATILANHITADDLLASAVAQKGSHIIIDDTEISTKDLDVKSLYATKMKSTLK
jgi:hypothetical protein